MYTVAFIGGDGSGKSSVTKEVLKKIPVRTKYLYMGMSSRSNHLALPTTRLMQFFKKRFYIRSKKTSKFTEETLERLYYEENRGADKRGKIGALLRLFNRWAEEWFRQIISWFYQKKGFVVIYDRHFLFEYAPVKNNGKDRLSEKIHRWTLNNLYPKPDLTIFLDAPSEILMARKGEASLEYLDSKREAYLRQGQKVANFFRIDCSQSLEKVIQLTLNTIIDFHNKKNQNKPLRNNNLN